MRSLGYAFGTCAGLNLDFTRFVRNLFMLYVCKKFVTMTIAEAIPEPLTNLLLELLKIYTHTVDEKICWI
jgi:hypothetical protein